MRKRRDGRRVILLTFASAFFPLSVVGVVCPSEDPHRVRQQQRQASHQEARQNQRHEEAVVSGSQRPSSSDFVVACGHLWTFSSLTATVRLVWWEALYESVEVEDLNSLLVSFKLKPEQLCFVLVYLTLISLSQLG